MPYAYSTFADLKTSLGQLLSDTADVFWTDTEKGILINSALREWNSITRMFRDRGEFQTNALDTFYDLRDVLENDAPEKILNPVITDAQLLQQAKYMLMEPFPDDVITFSDGYTAVDFNSNLVDSRNQLLRETGLVISQQSQVVASGDGRIILADDSIIDVRRASWLSLEGVSRTLFREDGFTSQSFTPAWPQSPGTPRRYSIYPDPLLILQLLPPPVDNGSLVLQTISSGAVLDDFTPFVLWGALADILTGPGPGNDPLRANYCKHRYEEGIIIGKLVTTVMQAFINGVPVNTDSVFNSDSFKPAWTTAGVPRSIGMLGSNLAAVIPKADGIYSITMDVSRNAPQLTDPTDLVPLGREYLDIFLNYVAHLARFKQGGQEFEATFPDYDAFIKTAVEYNRRMTGQNLHFETLVDREKRQEEQVSLRPEVAA